MKPAAFDYRAPHSLDEALQLIDANREAKLLAVAAEVRLNQIRREGVVAGGYRRMRRKRQVWRDLRHPGEFQRENTLLALGMARVLGAEAASLARGIALLALPSRRRV